MSLDHKCYLLRHFLATLAYRTHKALAGAPPNFATLAAGTGVRTPLEILCHMTRLLWYAHSHFEPVESPDPAAPTWQDAIDRFSYWLRVLDEDLERMPAKGSLNGRPVTPEELLQGPLSDAMTHAGQLALLRRLAGSPLPPERFIEATICVGQFPSQHQMAVDTRNDG